jgi:hypothetical protein
MTAKRLRRWLCLSALALLYALTWIGGRRSHARELQNRAQADWAAANALNQKAAHAAAHDGRSLPVVELRPGGPVAKIAWCVPVFPGLLFADSYYAVGPLWGTGGPKLVLFYGWGSVEVFTLFCWAS